MAKQATLKSFDGNKSAQELRSDWNWTVLAIILVTLMLIIAATSAFLFAMISPYTTAGSVNP